MSQPRSAAQGAAPRATPAATPSAAPAAATTRESAGTGQAPLLIELRTEELPPKALQRLSDAFTQTLLAAERARFHTLTLAEQRMLAELLHKLALAR